MTEEQIREFNEKNREFWKKYRELQERKIASIRALKDSPTIHEQLKNYAAERSVVLEQKIREILEREGLIPATISSEFHATLPKDSKGIKDILPADLSKLKEEIRLIVKKELGIDI